MKQRFYRNVTYDEACVMFGQDRIDYSVLIGEITLTIMEAYASEPAFCASVLKGHELHRVFGSEKLSEYSAEAS